jgi:hypothetical protein
MAAPIWAENMESITSTVGGTPRERSERSEAGLRPFGNVMKTFTIAAGARIV